MFRKTRRRIEELESICKYNEKRIDKFLDMVRATQRELELLSQSLGYNRVEYQAKVAYEKKGGPEKP
jgi:uncharacterized coiled-coil protein SlyX